VILSDIYFSGEEFVKAQITASAILLDRQRKASGYQET
jgi:hypothetical protein